MTNPSGCPGMQAGADGSRRQRPHRDLETQQHAQPPVQGPGSAAAHRRDKLVRPATRPQRPCHISGQEPAG